MTLTPEQLAERMKGIGGADAAAVLGVSRFKTQRQLYHEKRGEFPIDPADFENEVIWWGRALEPIVRQKYAEKSRRTVRLPHGTLYHPEHDFILAHIDGFSLDPELEKESESNLTELAAKGVLIQHCKGYEGKTAYQSLGWGEEGTDQIPTDCLIQTHHYIGVTGFPSFDVCVLIGRRFAYYEVKRDPEMIEMLFNAERKFWARVRAGEPPDLDFEHKTALECVKKLHPGTDGRRLIASNQAIAWRTALETAQKARKQAEATVDALKGRILDEMGDAALLAFPDGMAFRRQKITRSAYSVAETTYVDARFINDGKAPALKAGRK